MFSGIKNKNWDEVVVALRPTYGNIDLKIIQAIWKRLRDNYRRYYLQRTIKKTGKEGSDIYEPNFAERLVALDSVFEIRK